MLHKDKASLFFSIKNPTKGGDELMEMRYGRSRLGA
jgi:hypothetical protein